MSELVQTSRPAARQMAELVRSLQRRFADGLMAVGRRHGDETEFVRQRWLRDDGAHGGGSRLGTAQSPIFQQASINISEVHYDDDDRRPLGAAVAISSIIHPRDPRAPSVHLHFSLTEMKSGDRSFRLMADLNPSNPIAADTATFIALMSRAFGGLSEEARAQGDRYFQIPALKRTRGVAHFYLERFGDDASGDLTDGPFTSHINFVRAVAETAVDGYCEILGDALARRQGEPTPAQIEHQRAYHTLYLFQVLTLDRGTTSGLLVHDQNDLGIMGSLPTHVDRALLRSWADNVDVAQRPLVLALADALPPPGDDGLSAVDDDTRLRLAKAVRAFYAEHPAALALQATGATPPPGHEIGLAAENHQARA